VLVLDTTQNQCESMIAARRHYTGRQQQPHHQQRQHPQQPEIGAASGHGAAILMVFSAGRTAPTLNQL
jgi:hypothetical protein